MFRIEVLLCGSRRLLRFQFDFLICGNTEKITLQNSIPTLLQNKIVAADTRRNNNSAPEFAFVVPDKRWESTKSLTYKFQIPKALQKQTKWASVLYFQYTKRKEKKRTKQHAPAYTSPHCCSFAFGLRPRQQPFDNHSGLTELLPGPIPTLRTLHHSSHLNQFLTHSQRKSGRLKSLL